MCIGPFTHPNEFSTLASETEGCSSQELEFDLLFGDDPDASNAGLHQQRDEYRTFLYLRVLRRLCTMDTAKQRKVHEQVNAAAQRNMCAASRPELLEALRSELVAQGHMVFIIQSRGSGAAGFLRFRHSFLQVQVDQKCSTSHPWASPSRQVLIVEPQLREELQIVRPTPQYNRLLEALPSIFVGTASQLASIVEFMSERMAESFRQRGMCSPPWRQVCSRLREDVWTSTSHTPIVCA